MTRLALLAVVAALVITGCSGDSSTPTRGPLTTAELTWIRAESVWAIAIYDEERAPPRALLSCEIARGVSPRSESRPPTGSAPHST